MSAYDPAIHHRRSIRMRGHDYASGGKYFVTICVNKRAKGFWAKDFSPLLGTVVNGRMALNDAGRIAAQCWQDIPSHFPQVVLDEWIVMPDHVHGILILRDGDSEGAKDFSPLTASPTASRPCGTSRTIGSIVRGFKIGVTKSLGGHSPWQRGYYDIIIRDQGALSNIRRYILDNPANYDVHRYGEPRFIMGNCALLNLPITAFLASRDVRDGTHGTFDQKKGERFIALAGWPVRPQCVVSGFLSPMERTVFDACLAGGIPMVHILARGLPERFPPHIYRAIDAGKLLVMTPFEPAVDRFSAARAAWCTQYALHLAKDVVIGQVSQDGMLACLLSDLSHDTPVMYLNADESIKSVSGNMLEGTR